MKNNISASKGNLVIQKSPVYKYIKFIFAEQFYHTITIRYFKNAPFCNFCRFPAQVATLMKSLPKGFNRYKVWKHIQEVSLYSMSLPTILPLTKTTTMIITLINADTSADLTTNENLIQENRKLILIPFILPFEIMIFRFNNLKTNFSFISF